MAKDTCYLTDEETKIRNEIIEEKNKAYIDGFGYVAPAKTKTIIVEDIVRSKRTRAYAICHLWVTTRIRTPAKS